MRKNIEKTDRYLVKRENVCTFVLKLFYDNGTDTFDLQYAPQEEGAF